MLRLLTLAGVALAAVAALVAFLWFYQRRMIYFPMDSHVPSVKALLPSGSEVSFETEDGLVLQGWFVPPVGGTGSAAVLIFNGNAGSRAYRAPLAAAFAERGLAALLFDYRGYGGNPGSPSEAGLIRDARAARAFLESRPEIPAERTVYFGESLGAAVAVALATEHEPAALVLRSPFTSLVDVAKVHYPFLPVGLLLEDRYPSLRRIAGVSCPLLVVAGERDRLVPFEQSRALFDAATASEKRFVPIEGAGHNDPVLVEGRRLVDAVMQFLSEVLDG